MVTRRFIDFQVTFPGNPPISGYHYPEMEQSPGYHTRKLSNQAKGKVLWFVSKSSKDNLHSQPPDIITCFGLPYPEVLQLLDIVTWRLRNLWVIISKNCATSGYPYPEIATEKTFFANISAKTKYFSQIFWGFTQRPMYYRFMKKTRTQKSHATVPLKRALNRQRR